MRRLSTIVLFFVFTQYVMTTASTIPKDVDEVGAIEKIDVPNNPAVDHPNSMTDNLKCAQIGEPVSITIPVLLQTIARVYLELVLNKSLPTIQKYQVLF